MHQSCHFVLMTETKMNRIIPAALLPVMTYASTPHKSSSIITHTIISLLRHFQYCKTDCDECSLVGPSVKTNMYNYPKKQRIHSCIGKCVAVNVSIETLPSSFSLYSAVFEMFLGVNHFKERMDEVRSQLIKRYQPLKTWKWEWPSTCPSKV